MAHWLGSPTSWRDVRMGNISYLTKPYHQLRSQLDDDEHLRCGAWSLELFDNLRLGKSPCILEARCEALSVGEVEFVSGVAPA